MDQEAVGCTQQDASRDCIVDAVGGTFARKGQKSIRTPRSGVMGSKIEFPKMSICSHKFLSLRQTHIAFVHFLHSFNQAMWTKAALFSLLGGMLALSAVVMGDEVLQIHGSGTTNPSKCYWLSYGSHYGSCQTPHAHDVSRRRLFDWTSRVYWKLEGTTGANFIPVNDFGSGDIPISTEEYNSLTGAGVEFVHLPIVLGAISLFHSVPNVSTEPGQGLNLTACVISRIFKRDIVTWDDEDIVAMNPNLDLPSADYPITVAHRVLGSSSTASVTAVRA